MVCSGEQFVLFKTEYSCPKFIMTIERIPDNELTSEQEQVLKRYKQPSSLPHVPASANAPTSEFKDITAPHDGKVSDAPLLPAFGWFLFFEKCMQDRQAAGVGGCVC
jgi:hypothetical protein